MAVRSVRIKVGDRWYTVEVGDLSTSPVEVTVEGETIYVEVEGLTGGTRSTTQRPTPPRAPRQGPPQVRSSTSSTSEKLIVSPMPGRVIAVTVVPGDTVEAGQEVCTVEAMKMEQSIRSPRAGVIKTVHIQPMQQVGAGDPLLELA